MNSYNHGITMVNLESYIDRSVLEFPNKTAIEEPGRLVTYDKLANMAESIASYLSNSGIVRGDRIGILLPMSADYLVSFYAAWKIGAVAVPINNRFSVEDIQFVIGDAGLKALIISDSEEKRMEPVLKGNKSLITVVQGLEE